MRTRGFSIAWSFYPENGSGSRLAIQAQVGVVGHRPVMDEPPWHRGKYATGAVTIVSRHPRMGPDQLLVFLVDLADVAFMRLLRTVDCRDAVLDHVDEAAHDVAALAFRLEDHAAAMRRPGIGAEHAEEIREARHRQAEIGGRIIICPDIPQILAAAPRDIETRRPFGPLEAGRDDNQVRGPQLSLLGNNPIPTAPVDGIGAQLDIRPGQRF